MHLQAAFWEVVFRTICWSTTASPWLPSLWLSSTQQKVLREGARYASLHCPSVTPAETLQGCPGMHWRISSCSASSLVTCSSCIISVVSSHLSCCNSTVVLTSLLAHLDALSRPWPCPGPGPALALLRPSISNAYPCCIGGHVGIGQCSCLAMTFNDCDAAVKCPQSRSA